MNKIKEFITKDYYNLIIVLLIIVILFLSLKIVIDQGVSYFTTTENRIDFLETSINHTFPATRDEQKEPIIKKVQSNLLGIFFGIDVQDPITYAQVQFPASSLHQNNESVNVASRSGTRKSEFNIREEAEFVFEEFKIESDTNTEKNIENNEESSESGEELVIDSRKNIDLPDVRKPEKINFKADKPQILIYHTHTTESYKPASEGNYHSLREEYNVTTIGRIITEELEKRGFNVIHDTTYHDYPSYGGSYGRSLETAKGILKNNDSIQVVLDVHRDGYNHIDTNPNRDRIIESNRAKINGETTTKFQFVVGPDAENRTQIETFANFITAVGEEMYPGFTKPVLVKPYGRYNLFLTDYTALLELGSNANTIEEAKRSAIYFADVLATSLEILGE
ncbi:stage II sporulation protein P [Serpentinicella sp. ANB-PHB4]|uniref:stage II sporulation protein P n=1 Tax=Serpentinicella sp. ANB-PHB4 TaxID=3074076 RepID=UPI002861DDC8|nr:stage II sporulation protein P [Serpentinicella sp. ANB-PHB4]MDR5657964.1 stage II sporulation protein P [Serpentinicella sp. ANB-PHB4]